MQTEFEFTLPKGFLDSDGNVHRKGLMRLAIAMDEIVPLQDPRVKSNPAYATVLILARVITQLGALEEVSPRIVECFFACDLGYLQTFYREINELDTPESTARAEETTLDASEKVSTGEASIPEASMPENSQTAPSTPIRQSSPALI